MSGGKKKGPKYDHLLKLLLIGDSGVGKSCILLRYSDDSFTGSYITTIGIDFKIKNLVVESSKVKLQIWDTAGQERFRTITTAYYRGAMGILVVYDVTNSDSFHSVRNWLKQIDANAGPHVVRLLVGNKADSDDRVVPTSDGEALAKEFGINFFETSAKMNVNINEAFEAISSDIVGRLRVNPELFSSETSKTRKKSTVGGNGGLSQTGKKETKGCC